jgi:hypothetical protein
VRVIDRDDVGMIQSRGCSGLEREPALLTYIVESVPSEQFESDNPIKTLVPGSIYNSYTALANLL